MINQLVVWLVGWSGASSGSFVQHITTQRRSWGAGETLGDAMCVSVERGATLPEVNQLVRGCQPALSALAPTLPCPHHTACTPKQVPPTLLTL